MISVTPIHQTASHNISNISLHTALPKSVLQRTIKLSDESAATVKIILENLIDLLNNLVSLLKTVKVTGTGSQRIIGKTSNKFIQHIYFV